MNRRRGWSVASVKLPLISASLRRICIIESLRSRSVTPVHSEPEKAMNNLHKKSERKLTEKKKGPDKDRKTLNREKKKKERKKERNGKKIKRNQS